jgi:hypothetical protein
MKKLPSAVSQKLPESGSGFALMGSNPGPSSLYVLTEYLRNGHLAIPDHGDIILLSM